MTEDASNHVAKYVATQNDEEIARDANQIDSMPLATQNIVLKYNTTIAYTNEKNSVVPTGVPVGNTAIPTYIMIIVVLISILFAILMIKKGRKTY